MISQKTTESVMPIVANLRAAGKFVTEASDTPLAELVRAGISATTYVKSTQPNAKMYYDTIWEDSIKSGPDGLVGHDIAMDEIVAAAVDTVNANLNIARNEAMPTVKEIYAVYSKHMEELDIDAKSPVVIMPNIYSEVWGSPYLDGLVSRFVDVPLDVAEFPMALPSLSGEEIHAMIRTGIASFDVQIKVWLNNLPADKLVNTYNKTFVNKSVSVGHQIGSQHVVNGSNLDRNDLLMIFLIATGFEDNIPDGVNMPLEMLQLHMSKMREQAGRALAIELLRRERDVANEVLVYQVSEPDINSKRTVRVNNDVYLKYLKNGGTPESIYGAVINDGPKTVTALVDNAEKNAKTWNSFQILQNQRVAAQVYTAQRDSVLYAISKYIVSSDPESLPTAKDALQVRLRKVVGECREKDFDVEIVAVRNIVCDVLYANTNSKKLLLAMDAVEEANPSLEPREVALYATIDLVAQWVAGQMVVNYE